MSGIQISKEDWEKLEPLHPKVDGYTKQSPQRNNDRDELRRKINENPQVFLSRDNRGKGWVCPFCGSGTGENGTGMTNTIEGKPEHFTCWKCGFGGDVIDIIKEMQHTDYNGALAYGAKAGGWEYLLNKPTNTSSSWQESVSDKSPERPSESSEPKTVEKTIEKTDYWDFCREATHHLKETDYWKRRGLSYDTCWHFAIGYVEKWIHPKNKYPYPTPRLIIPLNRNGYTARDVRTNLSDKEKKYAKMKAGEASPFNFAALRREDIIFLVEGEIDAMSVYEVGYEAVGLSSINYKDKFLTCIKRAMEKTGHKPKAVIISLDNDESEETKKTVSNVTKYLKENLKKLDIITVVANISGEHKDANDALVADRDSFKAAVESAWLQAVAAIKEAEEKVALKPVRKMSRKDYYHLGKFGKDVEIFHEYFDRVTGFSNLDELTRLYPGLYGLGAVSSLGKTTFANQLSEQLTQRGHTVLYFSYEQSRFELFSKGMARQTYREQMQSQFSAIEIRRGAQSKDIDMAALSYANSGENEIIYEMQFDDTVDTICEEVEAVVAQGVRPVVMIDYLQVIAPSLTDAKKQMTAKENVDNIVKKLKMLQREHGLVVILISSLNRQNYLSLIDFESFKESGSLEYTCDVVWGLQLYCMYDEIFNKKEHLNKKRAVVKIAKKSEPRVVNLTCLKNRYGVASYNCFFKYYAKYDYFEPCSAEEAGRISAMQQAMHEANEADSKTAQYTTTRKSRKHDNEDDDDDDEVDKV